MTTDQTIDGVPRADLQAAHDELTDWKSPVAQRLRALLDAPDDSAGWVCGECGSSWQTRLDAPTAAQPQDDIETLRAALRTEVGAGDSWKREALELREKLENKPQGEGEPVAIVDESDDGLFIEFIYGENGNPLQRGDMLYAEQPASVAVADLTARLAAQTALLKELYNPLLEAAMEYDDKFEALAEEVAELIKIEDIAATEKVDRESQPAIHIPRGPGEYDGLDNGVD
ncbi:hypothetical protein [Pseudomonas gingeri]|uniref:hypothetical protein n=1 Tax=Pseudomonas gingeri TaxID=117681 RepID=UPI00159F7E1A|nr:hypothetical protein [Pseudomonas gingeri]NWA03760.1 hypothetical protein [Pseudomonas gingeri]NWA14619.1 hypothetical protein [Pseudomonas gingeri]NWA58747.1 hypothetical protein [Pseudomonas gingeri]NWA94487.1 hypothetical protein [Pseudomonas gingeri]NWB01143.1 hypothetical protein [Pseudomonas gingeri]